MCSGLSQAGQRTNKNFWSYYSRLENTKKNIWKTKQASKQASKQINKQKKTHQLTTVTELGLEGDGSSLPTL